MTIFQRQRPPQGGGLISVANLKAGALKKKAKAAALRRARATKRKDEVEVRSVDDEEDDDDDDDDEDDEESDDEDDGAGAGLEPGGSPDSDRGAEGHADVGLLNTLLN